MKQPFNFTEHPFNSVFKKSEHETIARNIMVILSRTGNEFRELTWEEYREQRIKDGNFSDAEKQFFDEVIGYCKSAETAKLFSKAWNK